MLVHRKLICHIPWKRIAGLTRCWVWPKSYVNYHCQLWLIGFSSSKIWFGCLSDDHLCQEYKALWYHSRTTLSNVLLLFWESSRYSRLPSYVTLNQRRYDVTHRSNSAPTTHTRSIPGQRQMTGGSGTRTIPWKQIRFLTCRFSEVPKDEAGHHPCGWQDRAEASDL